MISWGIIGCGDVTEVKSGPAFSKVPDSKLVAVMRRNADLARDYADRHGVPKWYADAEQLIGDPDVNAIYVATPPDSHLEYTVRALSAGKPVYVEKPMARNGSECRLMNQASTQAGLPLFVAFYRRMLPSFLHVRQLVADGAIGDIRVVQVTLHAPPGPNQAETAPSNWRVNPEIAGGGYFVDLAAHQFDYLDYVFGPIADVGGLADNQAGLYVAEDVVSASWKHESGVVGSGSWCFTASASAAREETLIVGSEGSIRFSFFAEPVVELDVGGVREIFEFTNPVNIQEPLIRTVVDELLGRGTCPSTGVSGARTSRVMESILTTTSSSS